MLNQLYYLIQRYKFESNSQLLGGSAINPYVVLSDTKIQIWKQFTTFTTNIIETKSCIIWYKDTNLKAIHNSRVHGLFKTNVVLSDTKIQIWKQFTTHTQSFWLIAMLYYLIQRYKFESNSQLIKISSLAILGCIIWYKDTNLKAIHNHLQRREGARLCCIIWYKDTNLKAIHNWYTT